MNVRFGCCASAAFLFFGLTSCGTPPPPRPQDIIPVSTVINSVKCGLAIATWREAIGEYPYKRLTGNVATVQLQLKVVDTRTIGGSGKATGIVAWQGGGISPYFSGSRANAWTVDTLLEASYELDATNTKVCAAAGIDIADTSTDNFGFANWLSDILVDLGNVSLDAPTGKLKSLTYDAAFALTEATTAGVGVQVAVFTADLNAAQNRGDRKSVV